MKNKLDGFLLATLWLVAVTLGACFWFNTIFSFNLMSGAHWQYLAGMQASRMAVNTWFYISLVATVAIAIAGTYVMVRPRRRTIRLAIVDTQKAAAKTPAANADVSPPAPRNDIAPQSENTPQPTTEQNPESQSAPQTLRRPPRLNMGYAPTNTYRAANAGVSAPMSTSAPATDDFARTSSPAPDAAINGEINDIFTSAGFVPKGAPKIKGVQTSIVAIGANETVWIGAVGATTAQMKTVTQTMAGVFSDTLDDIEIGINAFVISAPDAATAEFTDILLFNGTDELARYMADHPSPAIDPQDQGSFDAFSAYISTVVEYIGKI